VHRTAQRLLLSAAALKDKTARPLVVALLCMTVARAPSLVPASAAGLVAGIMGSDAFPDVAAEVVTMWATGTATVSPAGGAGAGGAAPASALCLCPPAAAEVLRELGRINSGPGPKGSGAASSAAGGSGGAALAGARDTAGLRRAATFLALAADRLPHVVLANVSVLLPYLDCDASTLRSALIGAVGSILVRAHAAQREVAAAAAASGIDGATSCSSSSSAVGAASQHDISDGPGGDGATGSGDSASPSSNASGGMASNAVALPGVAKASLDMARLMNPRTRDTLLTLLADRCYDVHAITRAATLKTWLSLVLSGVIPLDRLQRVTALAVERLRDKGALVRKAAAALLRALLEHNPFGAVLSARLFEGQAERAEQWLAAHAPHLLPGAGPLPAAPGAATGAHAAADGAGERDENAGTAANEPRGADASADADGAAAAAVAATAAVAAAEPPPPSPEAAQRIKLRAGCLAAAAFARAMESAVPVFASLMRSKTGSDVMEAIRCVGVGVGRVAHTRAAAAAQAWHHQQRGEAWRVVRCSGGVGRVRVA
jgi:hypothetical protein